MFEKKDEDIAPLPIFLRRVAISFAIAWFVIGLAVCIGIAGFRYFEDISLLNAFENSAMILSTMGPVIIMKTNAGKLFAAFYALFSGLVFVTMMGLIFAPILHRCYHMFHSGHIKLHKKA